MSTRPGDVEEGASGPAHTKAASVANLVPRAARVDVAANLEHGEEKGVRTLLV